MRWKFYMLNYYDKVAEPNLFIMDVKEEDEYLIVIFADDSIRYFKNNNETKKKIEKARDKQMKKLLKNYSSKEMKKKYNKKRKKIIEILTIVTLILGFVTTLIISLISPSSFVMIVSGLACSNAASYIIMSKIASKLLAQLQPLKLQIEEIEKLEFFQKNEKVINGFIKKLTKEAIDETLQQDKSLAKEGDKIKKEATRYAKLSIHRLDCFELEQLKQLLNEIIIEQTIGSGYNPDNQLSTQEEAGHSKIIEFYAK